MSSPAQQRTAPVGAPLATPRRAARLRTAEKAFRIATIAVTVLTGIDWLRSMGHTGAPNPLLVVVGFILAVVVVAALLAKDTSLGRRIVAIVLTLVLMAQGAGSIASMDNRFSHAPGGLSALQSLWSLLALLAMVSQFVLPALLRRAERADGIELQRSRELAYEQTLLREQNRQTSPSTRGRMTGFEPAALEGAVLARPQFMFGNPGAGLSGSGFGAAAVELGQLGEVNFAKALQSVGQLDRVASFWSVHMPSETVGAHERFASDIDCVVVTGTTVWLLDMKMYVQGDVIWRNDAEDQLACVDRVTGNDVGSPRHMSRNMAMATDVVARRLQALGLNYQVKARVVFMPTDDGLGAVQAVWPGGIPACDVQQALAELQNDPPFQPQDPRAEHVVRMFRWLVKDESGSAPRPGHVHRADAPVAPTSRIVQSGPPTPATVVASPDAASAPPIRQDSAPVGAEGVGVVEGAGAGPASGVRHCAECGTVWQPDWTFCYSCGSAVAR